MILHPYVKISKEKYPTNKNQRSIVKKYATKHKTCQLTIILKPFLIFIETFNYFYQL